MPVNQNIMLYGYDMWMRGKLEPTGTNLDQTLFITLPTAYAMARSSRTTAVKPLVIPIDSVSSVMVKVKHGQDPGTVARTITNAPLTTDSGCKIEVRPRHRVLPKLSTWRGQN